MPGDAWQEFANLRLLLAYMYTHPGKKLLFMGTELAPENEWNHDRGLDWNLLADPARQGVNLLMKDLGALYNSNPALWEWDHDRRGFSWIDCRDWKQSVISYVRRSSKRYLVCVLNLTPVVRYNYRVGVPEAAEFRELLNTDSACYGGSNIGNEGSVEAEPEPFHGYAQSLSLTLPPLSCLIFEPKGGVPAAIEKSE
jgi:1,4-alpha-glucan branching enzyme